MEGLSEITEQQLLLVGQKKGSPSAGRKVDSSQEEVPVEDPHPAKRLRLSSASASGDSFLTKEPCFLPLHLSLLKSLHGMSEDDEDNDKNVFSKTEKFLQSRSELLRARREAICWKGIHGEAMKWSYTSGSEPEMTAHSDTGSLRRRSFSPRQHLMTGSSAFPSYQRPHRGAISQFAPSGGNSPINKSQPRDSSSSFFLVAGLLGKRSERAAKISQHRASSHVHLLDSVEDRIRKLQEDQALGSILHDNENRRLLDRLLSSNPTIVREGESEEGAQGEDVETRSFSMASLSERSDAAAVSCKLHLWRMLAHDLKQVMR